jgi:hypothetical protein
MLIPSISVLFAAVALNSLIFVFGMIHLWD